MSMFLRLPVLLKNVMIFIFSMMLLLIFNRLKIYVEEVMRLFYTIWVHRITWFIYCSTRISILIYWKIKSTTILLVKKEDGQKKTRLSFGFANFLIFISIMIFSMKWAVCMEIKK